MPVKPVVKILTFLLCLVFWLNFSINDANAATKYWIGSNGGLFSDDVNWSTSSGGANNTTAPGASDIATFDSGGTNNASIASTVSVAGIDIKSTYSGTISQAVGADVTVGTSNFSIAGGTYSAGTALTTINGTFSLTGGTYTASSATTTFKKAFTKTSGTFTHNSGTVAFDPTSASFTIAANSTTFNNVTFLVSTLAQHIAITITQGFTVEGNMVAYNNSAGFGFSIYSQSSANPTITINGNLTMPNTANANQGTGMVLGSVTAASNFTINLQGNLSINDTAVGYYATTVFTGTGDQTISRPVAAVASTTMSSTKVSGNLNITTYAGGLNSDWLNWNGGTITADNGVTFGLLRISSGTFNVGTTTIYDRFSLQGGTFVASSATTTFKSYFTKTDGTFTHNNGIVFFDPTSITTVVAAGSATFYNLILGKTGSTGNTATIYLDDSFTVANNVSLYNTGPYQINVKSRSSLNPTITVGGNLDFPNTSTNAANLGSATASETLTVSLQGNLTFSDSDNGLYAPIVFSGTGNQTITKTAGIASTTLSSTKVSGNLNITTYSGSVSSDLINWSSGSITADNGLTFGGLRVSGGTFNMGSSTVSAAFVLQGGTFVASSATTTFKSTFTRTAGTLTHNSGIVFFDPSALTTVIAAGSSTFYNVVFGKTGSPGNTASLYLDDSFTVANNVSLYNTGPYQINVKSRSSLNPTITVSGNLDFPNASVNAINLGSATASETLTVSLQGNLTLSDSDNTLYAPITFSGTGDQTVTKTAGTFGAASIWTINKSSGSVVLGSTFTHPSSIIATLGTLDINALNLTVTSTFSFASSSTLKLRGSETVTTPTLSRGSTVYYYGTAGPYTLKNYTYHHLTIDGSGATFTAPALLNVNGDLTINAGTFASGGYNFNLFGNWSNSGTYTHSNNTVSFIGGNQSIRGSSGTTFYNLTKSTTTLDTFTFPSAVTTTISNNTNLSGISGARLSIRSDSSGSQSSVNISNSGTRTIQYVDVKDNNNTNATAVTCNTECVNSLNNTNWTFVTGLVLTTDAASAVTSTGGTLNGNITATGNEDASEHGFAYGTSATLATTIATTTLGAHSGTGTYSESITGLSPNTIYYFRAYATNSAGTGYGAIDSFTSSTTAPTVTVDIASSITQTTASLNGNITATGGENATEHGFAYSTSATLATTISTTTLGAYSGTGSFTESISSLTCNTTYYFRPYATNSGGTGYSDSIISFTTSACTVAPTATGNRSGSRPRQVLTDVFTYLYPTNKQKSGTSSSTIIERLPTIETSDIVTIDPYEEVLKVEEIKTTDSKIDNVEVSESTISKIISFFSSTLNSILKVLHIK